MRVSRTIDFHNNSGVAAKAKNIKRRNGKVSVSMYSDFFSSLDDKVMCTNAMFGNLQKEIESTILPYSEKEPISLTVYESSACSDDTKESVVIGFKKYITQCLERARITFQRHMIVFSLLCAVSLLLEFLLYEVFPGLLHVWIQNVLDIVAWVFEWQFAAYMAFESVKEIKAIRRFDQILQIEYIFRHWE